MPTPRIGLAAAAVGDVVYAIGGSTAYGQIWIGSIGTTGVASVDAYDVSTGTWSTKAPMPEARVYPAGATVIDGKIYVVGGISPGAWTNTLFIYDPAAGPQGTWTVGPPMPDITIGGASAAINGQLYVITGFDRGNRVWRYDPPTETWEQLPTSPWGHSFGSAAAISGKLYVAGGEGVSSVLDVYDPSTNQWSQSYMPVGYQHHSAVTVDGRMYLVGGNVAFPSQPCCAYGRTVMGFDPQASSWTAYQPTVTAGGPYIGNVDAAVSFVASATAPLAPTGVTRDLPAAAAVGSAIYLLGGGDPATQSARSSAEMTNPAGPGALTVAWDFGDGQQGAALSASHTYSDQGAYTSVVTVSTDDGLTASASAAVTIGPALLHYDFAGFYAPVDNPDTVNTAKAGSAIPIKFRLGGNQTLDIFLPGGPVSSEYACGSAPTAPIEVVVAASSSGLTYDAASDTYVYVWKTDKSWVGTCRQFRLNVRDHSTHVAYFQFK
jgi:N-acetylneuraminic acid mutarotase